MPRAARKESPSGLYHVTMRGVGRQLIFEDDADRRSFLRRLHGIVRRGEVDCFAWCLMGNHVHLLLGGALPAISSAMQRLGAGYASHFNARHDRVGHLFQGRFGSEPVVDEEQLLATVRYIHLNPTKAYDVPPGDYRWSSYREYLGCCGAPALASYDKVMLLFGDVKRFVEFHEDAGGGSEAAPALLRVRLGEEEARRVAAGVLGDLPPDAVKALPKEKRNDVLRRLRAEGLTIKQIERLTSIGRNIIARAK